jgi:DNA-binding transcriptional LysR family regulator
MTGWSISSAGVLDVAIRIGSPADSSAIMRKLAENRRILVAAPAYLNRAGRPATPDEAVSHAPSWAEWSDRQPCSDRTIPRR